MPLRLESSAFKDGDRIPDRFTCSGQDVSPALRWSDAPSGTASFVLICDDPDAPMMTWVHWVVYNIPGNSSGLPEDVPKQRSLRDGSLQGENSWKRIGYGGPCPPRGKPHRYYFKLYAIDRLLELKPGASKKEVQTAMDGHVVAQAELVGIYGRS